MPLSNHYKRSRNKRRKHKKPLCDQVSIVGPDCVQILKGNLFGKQVSLVLCGESHYDAIDVTRSGGRFHAKYGWIETNPAKLCKTSSITDRSCHLLLEAKKNLPLNKAKEWAKEIVEDQDDEWSGGEQLLLLWIPTGVEAKTIKGKSYLLELVQEDDLDEEESHADDPLPVPALQWIEKVSGNEQQEEKDSSFTLFEWGDLDLQAHELNRRRLTDEEIDPAELDAIVEKRKLDRKKQNIWTFDDWFSHIKAEHEPHLILEASVPPWEVELHRPTQKQQLVPAHDCIRCVSEDSDESTADMHDPSLDGVGSYIDFVYRKFMTQMLMEQQQQKDDITEVESTWLHCVDTRDLGCEAACHAEEVKKRWNDLLLPQEYHNLLGDKEQQNGRGFESVTQPVTNPDEAQDAGSPAQQLFRPASRLNAELVELESLRAWGTLQIDNDDDACECEGTNLDFTFPSFEGFFGQCTDSMYYAPHVKLSYSPFLAKCAGSFQKWEDFMSNLFFGGTIPDALNDLKIQPDCVYVRSPILKEWDPVTHAYTWRERDETDQFLSYPYFPHIFYLKAKNSMPPRTWSSQLYANLTQHVDDKKSSPHVGMNRRALAEAARKWALSSVARHSADPKGSDDVECGGEWFASFLRAAHRDIYDDIDLTDQAVLLQRNYITSESGGRRAKHNIGKIKIPSAQEGFTEILQRLEALNEPLLPDDEKIISARVEALAKILIDIWISILVDFSTVLKIADIISRDGSENNQVVVVCYMGTVHVRAIADFYCKKIGFRKTTFVGKYVWDEEEVKTLRLPSKLWNLSELF